MLLKLSEYENIPGFNRVTSAIIKENNLPISSYEDFGRFFPDIIFPANNFSEFLEKMEVLENTEKFVEKLSNFDKNKNICVFGDYDADGVMATIILTHTLQKLGFKTIFKIPNRLEDGYGMKEEKIEKIIKENNISLIITVDTGISSKECVKKIKDEFNCDVIVTDHHIAIEENVPDALIICNNGICGANVALKLSYALCRKLNPKILSIIDNLAPLAGIATITDMMPCIGENRQLVRLTLEKINYVKFNNMNCPLFKIIQALGGYNFLKNSEDYCTEELISYYIGPTINAVSRVNGDVNGLTEKIIEIFNCPWRFIPSYSSINYERQKISNELLSNFILDENFKFSSIFVYEEKNYPFKIKGVLGLLANKISNKHNIVSLVGAKGEGTLLEFSARSTPNYNINKGIERLKKKCNFEISGGGHAQAMGIRFEEQYLNIFKYELERDIQENIELFTPNIFEWEECMEEEIVESIGDLQPYGAHFQKLKFQYNGILSDFNLNEKIIFVGDYKFKTYLPYEKINKLMGTNITVTFTIVYNNINGPMFTMLTENLKD